MEMAKHNRWRVPGKYGTRWVMVLMALAFLAFAAFLVARASFVARNGQRYFIIDDDELISLRYAWNLAHGHGLVWNPGERVEGFTDLLWTLYASAWAVVIPRRLLPLVMQVSGMALLLGQAAVFARIVRAMYAERGRTTPWVECVAFALPLAFYPLVYWSVQGMEVCLVGFLFSLAVLYYIRCRWVACAVALGLGFWTRPDVALPAALIMGMAGIDALRDRRRLGQWLTSCGVLAGMVATVFILRRLYYGQTWPNTYVLKMQGLSLMDRITMNGIGYIMPFLRENILPLGIALAGIVLAWSWRRILFAAIVLSMIAYSIVVGGDTLPYWRFIAPFAPFLGLIFLTEGRDIIRHPAYRYALQTALLATLFISWIAVSIKPFSEMNRGQELNERANIEVALELNRLLRPGATVGVLHAGAIPYYTDFHAYDFLGKCDPGIAQLPPHVPPHAPAWRGMRSVPGHNKYDLYYSIAGNQPTYIQSWYWWDDDVKPYVLENYEFVPTSIDTPFSRHFLLLRKGDPCVRWELIHPRSLLSRSASLPPGGHSG